MPPSEADLEKRMLILLKNVGDPGYCKDCNAPIFWVRHNSSKVGIYNHDGSSHFSTCPNAKRFRKRSEV